MYLAVESIEESFLQRNYGNDWGELYKPDADNGEDNMGRRSPPQNGADVLKGEALRQALEQQRIPTDRLGDVDWDTVTMEDLPKLLASLPGVDVRALAQALTADGNPERDHPGLRDVKLLYIDEDPQSYPNIFDNAKTDITDADRARLIQALQRLNAGQNIKQTVDIEEVIRYFVVHTFVCNEDSYTGSTVHNYYLYEKNGVLSMLPWDYNLAFGGIPTGDASSVINASVYSPVISDDNSQRPILDWIFESKKYTQLYEQYYTELLAMDMVAMADRTADLIAPYVRQDPTKFCSYEEFETGVAAMKRFLDLRVQSIHQQLDGQPPRVDPGDLELSDMGGVSKEQNRPPQP